LLKDHAMIPPILPTYSRAPLTFVKGEGSWLIEADGRRFLDLGAGIAVNALGHAHPALVAALTEQAGALWHTSNLYNIPAQQDLAERLVEATFADTVFFTNSGTEACELAVKMARKHFHDAGQPERTDIIAFEGAFHGRSSAAIAAAGSEKMTKGFGPLLPGFKHLPWGDHDALHAAIDENTAAILIEPVQGEGGIRPLPDQCLKGLRALCDEHGILLILDEVQCGMGRTGRLFAHEWAGITPDIMMVAKGIGGGFPLGAVLATERAASAMGAGTHGSTYGGNPLGCAVGCAVMAHVATPEFLSEVNRKAGLLRQRLEGLVAAHPDVFTGVRGLGLMLGLTCKAANTDVVQAGYDALIATVPAADNVVRLLPPLTITDDEIAEAITRLDAAASAVETA
jgi:acetylornithine/N-succinyldiaminopimelate aminotransferase